MRNWSKQFDGSTRVFEKVWIEAMLELRGDVGSAVCRHKSCTEEGALHVSLEARCVR